MAKKLLLWLESGMMMVLDFRIWSDYVLSKIFGSGSDSDTI